MANKNVSIIDDQNFEAQVLESEVPVLVDFHSVQSRECKLVTPLVDEFAAQMHGKLKVVRLDIDKAPRIAREWNIRTAPTLVMVVGGVATKTHVGVIDQKALDRLAGRS